MVQFRIDITQKSCFKPILVVEFVVIKCYSNSVKYRLNQLNMVPFYILNQHDLGKIQTILSCEKKTAAIYYINLTKALFVQLN